MPEVRVYVPGPLRSYTRQRSEVRLELDAGASVGALLDEMDRQFPGIRFRMIDEAGRIREHIRLFVAGELASDLDAPAGGEVQIICAISGGLEPPPGRKRLLGQDALKEVGVEPIEGQ